MLMKSVMKIPKTLNIVIECWNKAESNIRENVREKYHDYDEEFLTRLFCGEFSFELREASKKGRIAKAFLEDLRSEYPKINYSSAKTITENLIADIHFHKRHVEKVTGGDFGFTIARPNILLAQKSYSPNTIEVNPQIYQRGLLCQAKLKNSKGWGKFTPNQKKVLPGRLRYLALLLYDSDEGKREVLGPFKWQLCNDQDITIEMISNWLKSGSFPSASSSSKIIKQLGNAEIGTDDKEILERIIKATDKPQFSISIHWPDDKKPPDSIQNSNHSYNKDETKQEVYIGRG